MCRSIKVLRRPDTPVTPEEISAAALQFVRKVSGSHKPSKVNQQAFDAAVQEIAAATERLLKQMPSRTTTSCLLIRVCFDLRFEHPERADQAAAGFARLDHVVDEAVLGCDERAGETLVEFSDRA